MKTRRMTKLEVARETRKQRRLELLGTVSPHCGTCGFNRWQALELHHPGRKMHDPAFTVIECKNCHGILSDDQKDHPSIKGDDPFDAELAKFGHFMLGLADMQRLTSEKLHEFGLALIDRASTQVTKAQCEQAKHSSIQ
jgi:hypothetical protein